VTADVSREELLSLVNRFEADVRNCPKGIGTEQYQESKRALNNAIRLLCVKLKGEDRDR